MLNYIWAGMLIFGIGFACINGRIEQVATALLDSGGSAVTFSIGIIGITALWCGMLEVLDQGGGLNFFNKILRKPITKLFPECKANPKAGKAIITNLTANFFGLGNGATPSGIQSVSELQRCQRGNKETACRSICLFLVINSAAFQLMPTTVLAIRSAAGSENAMDIIVPVWIASIAALITGILVFFLCRGRKGASE